MYKYMRGVIHEIFIGAAARLIKLGKPLRIRILINFIKTTCCSIREGLT